MTKLFLKQLFFGICIFICLVALVFTLPGVHSVNAQVTNYTFSGEVWIDESGSGVGFYPYNALGGPGINLVAGFAGGSFRSLSTTSTFTFTWPFPLGNDQAYMNGVPAGYNVIWPAGWTPALGNPTERFGVGKDALGYYCVPGNTLGTCDANGDLADAQFRLQPIWTITVHTRDSGGAGVGGVTIQSPIPYGTTSVQTTDAAGNVVLTGYAGNNATGFPVGSWTISVLGVPGGYAMPTPSSQTVTIPHQPPYGPKNFDVFFTIPTPPPPPTSTITGTAYIDQNGSHSPVAQPPATGTKVVLSLLDNTVVSSVNTDANGKYTFNNVPLNTYKLTLLNISTNTAPCTTTLNPITLLVNTAGPYTEDFGVCPPPPPVTYTITGTIFNDENRNGYKEATEPDFGTFLTINSTVTGGTLTRAGNKFTVSVTGGGSGKISLTSAIPAGYQLIYPLGGPPPAFTVIVGPGCSISPTNPNPLPGSAVKPSCDAGDNIINLNFALSDSFPWFQTTGTDMRFDNGLTDRIPNTVACTGVASLGGTSIATNHGVLFDSSGAFGHGAASTIPIWQVGTGTHPETYSPIIAGEPLKTSYSSILATVTRSGTPVRNMNTVSGCSNITSCSLPNGVGPFPTGVYRAFGSLTITNDPTLTASQKIIILVDGDLTLDSTITLNPGTTILFAVQGNIYVDKTVGTVPSCAPASYQLEGFYTTEKSFVIQGKDPNNTTGEGQNCLITAPTGGVDPGPDLQLNIHGAVVVNAALKGDGTAPKTYTFKNQRDLCSGNISAPSFSVTPDLDLLLNAPDFIKTSSYLFQEVAP